LLWPVSDGCPAIPGLSVHAHPGIRVPISQSLTGGQQDVYKLKLDAGQNAAIILEQKGIDTEIYVLDPGNNLIAYFNDDYRTQGEERISIYAAQAGDYKLNVDAFANSAPAGAYQISLIEVRPGNANDRLMQEARTLLIKAQHAASSGQHEESHQMLETALFNAESVVGTDDLFTAKILMALCDYYDNKQDVAKSTALKQRALAIYEKTVGAEHPLTAVALQYLAWSYNDVNQLSKALPLATRSVEILEKTVGPNHYRTGEALYTLGKLTSDRKKAGEYFSRALAIVEKARPGAELGMKLLDANATFAIEGGDFKRAEEFSLKALALKEKLLAPSNIGFSVTLNDLGREARERKDYEKAEQYYSRAITIVENAYGKGNRRLAVFLNNLANVYRAKGDYAKSLETHQQVLRICETSYGPYHPLTLLSLGNIARTHAAMGNIPEAIKFQIRVDSVIERNIELNLAIGSERQKLNYLQGVSERTDRTISLNSLLAGDDVNASALAALVLLQRKGRVLDAMSESFAAMRQRSKPEEQELLTEFNKTAGEIARLVLNGPPQSMAFEEHQKLVSDLEERKDKLEAEISRRNGEFLAGSQPVSLGSVQAAIPSGATLIEFAVYRPFDPKIENSGEAYGAPRYIAYVINSHGIVRWKDLGDARQIDEAVELMRKSLRDPLKTDIRERSRVVDQKVMQPLRTILDDSNHLLISPDGALNLIPFEALTDEQGHYLIQRYSFTYLTSGRDLLRLQVGRTKPNPSLVIAAPAFGQQGAVPGNTGSGRTTVSQVKDAKSATDAAPRLVFPPLSGSEQEALAIKSLFLEARSLIGAEATESTLKGSAAPRILHIATHGFFLGSDQPAATGASRSISSTAKVTNPLLRSGLALAGANLSDRASGDDGILTALEASGLNLWGTKLVTLSACDTGVGEVTNGEGVYGASQSVCVGRHRIAGDEPVASERLCHSTVDDRLLPRATTRKWQR
jgi:CHAT domain-containing protein